MDDLKGWVRKSFEGYLSKAKQRACNLIPTAYFGRFTFEEIVNAINNLDYIVFEVPEHQFGQDTDSSESVLERLRREFDDLFPGPLKEVAGKVGMLGNVRFYAPEGPEDNAVELPEFGSLVIYNYNGYPKLSKGVAVRVHFELGPERVGKEARFSYDNYRKTEFKSIPDAFKELVRILEEQGQMIPKI
ncbi:MAG: hypothetical protein Q8R34_01225 [bacterium]|nr:hypothetical protein [bacterium]